MTSDRVTFIRAGGAVLAAILVFAATAWAGDRDSSAKRERLEQTHDCRPEIVTVPHRSKKGHQMYKNQRRHAAKARKRDRASEILGCPPGTEARRPPVSSGQ